MVWEGVVIDRMWKASSITSFMGDSPETPAKVDWQQHFIAFLEHDPRSHCINDEACDAMADVLVEEILAKAGLDKTQIVQVFAHTVSGNVQISHLTQAASIAWARVFFRDGRASRRMLQRAKIAYGQCLENAFAKCLLAHLEAMAREGPGVDRKASETARNSTVDTQSVLGEVKAVVSGESPVDRS